MRLFSIPAVAAAISIIVVLSLPIHPGNAGLFANSLRQAVGTSILVGTTAGLAIGLAVVAGTFGTGIVLAL